MEAGEKSFQMEEALIFPPSVPPVAKILHYDLMPVITEYKVLAGRLVFRGDATLHLVYMSEDGQVCSWNWELPFSQYTELDKDYSPNANAEIIPIVTAMELDQGEDGNWMLKAGIAAQYVIRDRTMLELTKDAYSPNRSVKINQEELKLPMHLDTYREEMTIRQEWDDPTRKVVDTVWYHDHPRQHQQDDQLEMEIPGQFQVLYLDENGQLQGVTQRTENRFSMRNDPNNRVEAYPYCVPGSVSGNGVLSADAVIDCAVTGLHGLTMVTGLEIGEINAADPGRPSLILRRAGNDSLWDIAKSSGSTMDAIRKANALEEEPNPAQMLLIPIP
jgi:hypothetical protein